MAIFMITTWDLNWDLSINGPQRKFPGVKIRHKLDSQMLRNRIKIGPVVSDPELVYKYDQINRWKLELSPGDLQFISSNNRKVLIYI